MRHIGRRPYAYLEEVNDGIWRQFREMQPPGGKVLDVGCGRAALGAAIRAQDWQVWGIEQNPEACRLARARLDGLVEADLLDAESIARQLPTDPFDVLVFSDVLEHVYDPRGVLEAYLPYVRPGGKVLVSVPNAVVWTNRLAWCLGRVTYADTGVMDRTHLRFFTFRTARQVVEAAGCRVEKMDFTPHLVRAALPLVKGLLAGRQDGMAHDPRALINSPAYQWYLRYVYPVERVVAGLWKTLFAFRIIVVASKV